MNPSEEVPATKQPRRWERDAFFKNSMARPEVVAPLLRQQLPAPLVEALDWSTLAIDPADFPDPIQSNRAADLIFRIHPNADQETETPAYIHVLFEHQSRAEDIMPYRILHYMVRLWERHLQNHSLPLPLVYPLVLHQAPRPWNKAQSLGEILHLPEGVAFHDLLARSGTPLFPDFAFHLIDLDTFNFDQLRHHTLCHAVLGLMKTIEKPLSQQQISATINLLHASLSGNNTDLYQQLLEYLFHNAQPIDKNHIIQHLHAMNTTDPDSQPKTIADYLIEHGVEQGIEQGREQGIHNGQRTVLLRLLQRRFGDLPQWVHDSVEEASPSRLESLIDGVLEASSLDDLFRS
jgi:predicted transposase/invertase (TIGR01784 family)